MNLYYYSLLIVFSIVAIIMVIDPNVATYFDLLIRKLILDIKRIYWMIRLHPDNPIARWNMERRSKEMATKLQKEFTDKDGIPRS